MTTRKTRYWIQNQQTAKAKKASDFVEKTRQMLGERRAVDEKVHNIEKDHTEDIRCLVAEIGD